MEIKEIQELGERIKRNISKVIVGKDEIIDLILVALICKGHILLEDVPGVGKTMLAKCLARSIHSEFKRVQFTPDLLPSDLTGINYFDQKKGEFVFRSGPIFTNILLADEINRATPRTQSSLLECMEEAQVSIDGETKVLGELFLVIATQNPVETQGTFPLPEAQLDRFMMRLKMNYPSKEEGRLILDRFEAKSPLQEVFGVVTEKDIIEAQENYSHVTINHAVKGYIIDLVEATRKHEKVLLGVSPRGSIALMKAAKAFAAIKGRRFVMPDDIKVLAVPVLAHRLVIKGYSLSSGTFSPEGIISSILKEVPTPIEDIG